MSYLQHSYVSVTKQRNERRIWLQGLRLTQAGFDKGERYRVDYDMDTHTIQLVKDPHGNRLVSGRKKMDGYDPIIDLCNAEITQITQGVTRVRVDLTHGQITITTHHFESKKAEREDRLKTHLQQGFITKGDLCVGIGMAAGALKQGFDEQGLKTRLEWVVDRERRYLQVACDNNLAISQDTVLFEATLEELEPSLLRPVDLVQVSLPCTGHSIAGKSKNKIKMAEQHSTDATAIFGLMRTIECCNPSIIVSENVREAQNSATYILLKGMLEQMGYKIHEIVLDNKKSGSFECRVRYWFVAVSDTITQIDLNNIPAFTRRYQQLSDLLESISDDDPMWSDNTYLKDKQERDKAAGKGFANRQLVTGKDTVIGAVGKGYAKRRSTEPFIIRGDGKERLLTPVEHARVKSAPEKLVENIPMTLAHEGLGQGIDWNQGRGIAQLLAITLKEREPGLSTLAPESEEESGESSKAKQLEKTAHNGQPQLALF